MSWEPAEPLPRLWGELATTGFTGQLRLAKDGRHYATWWREGVLCDAESTSPEDTLGRVALDAGLIDASTLAESIRRMAATGKSQVDVLNQMGVLAGPTLERARRAAFTRRALRMLALPRATVAVSTIEHTRSDGEPLEPRWVLYRGIRTHFDEARLDVELGWASGQALRLSQDPAQIPEGFGFQDDERVVLAYLHKGFWELPDLVEACVSMPRAIVLATVLALDGFRLVEQQPAGSVPRLRKRSREATAGFRHVDTPPHGTVAPPPPRTPPQGVPRTPPTSTPPQRPTQRMTSPTPQPRPATTPPTRPSGTGPPAPGERRHTMSMPPVEGGKRNTGPIGTPPLGAPAGTGVSAAIREQILVKFAQVEGNVDHFTLLELDRGATPAQAKTAYFSLAKTYHPDRLALLGLTELRPQVERIFARLSDAFSVLGDDAKRKAYLDVLAQGGEAAIKRKDNDEAARAAKILSAEEHFRRGEMALRRAQWQQAIDEFKLSVDMNPAEAEHHAMLAWATWSASDDKGHLVTETKRALNKAIELNPRCVPAFFFLGQVYKHSGDLTRAYHAFHRASSLQPGHVDADREIRLIEMRRDKEKDKGGLFDRFRKK